MPRIQTKCLGEVEYSPDAVFTFPIGIPGFENEHAFVFLERPGSHPLMFMQSLATPELCFILMPVLAADPHYKLRLAEEDLAAPSARPQQPRIGKDLLCAVVVAPAGRIAPIQPPTCWLPSWSISNRKSAFRSFRHR